MQYHSRVFLRLWRSFLACRLVVWRTAIYTHVGHACKQQGFLHLFFGKISQPLCEERMRALVYGENL
jgi:hypothetical protein